MSKKTYSRSRRGFFSIPRTPFEWLMKIASLAWIAGAVCLLNLRSSTAFTALGHHDQGVLTGVGITVIRGDATNEMDLRRALRGAEAVATDRPRRHTMTDLVPPISRRPRSRRPPTSTPDRPSGRPRRSGIWRRSARTRPSAPSASSAAGRTSARAASSATAARSRTTRSSTSLPSWRTAPSSGPPPCSPTTATRARSTLTAR